MEIIKYRNSYLLAKVEHLKGIYKVYVETDRNIYCWRAEYKTLRGAENWLRKYDFVKVENND